MSLRGYDADGVQGAAFTGTGVGGQNSARSELSEHHQCITFAQGRVTKRTGKPPDDLEAMALPQVHRTRVRCHNKIVLNGGEIVLFRCF